jgi:hypothetical protein
MRHVVAAIYPAVAAIFTGCNGGMPKIRQLWIHYIKDKIRANQ